MIYCFIQKKFAVGNPIIQQLEKWMKKFLMFCPHFCLLNHGLLYKFVIILISSLIWFLRNVTFFPDYHQNIICNLSSNGIWDFGSWHPIIENLRFNILDWYYLLKRYNCPKYQEFQYSFILPFATFKHWGKRLVTQFFAWVDTFFAWSNI